MPNQRLSKTAELIQLWKPLLIGQDHAIERIVPYVVRALAGLSTPGKPIGVFFLLGPSGTGKTRTAETLAEILHGLERNVLRIDCGEYQLDHEIAKLIGAPPGYLGHRETHPVFAQARISAVATEKCPFSIILFDEIEKASSSMWRLLLGILDKATIRLGDNSTTDFSQTIIFLSSNLGAKEMSEMLTGGFGFTQTKMNNNELNSDQFSSIERIGLGAIARKFPPEFPNRIDEIITYHPLSSDNLHQITKLELQKVQVHVDTMLSDKRFSITFPDSVVQFITKAGTNTKYGARELKRAVNRYVMNPLADDFIALKIRPGAEVFCKVINDKVGWDIENRGPFLEDDADYEFLMPLIEIIPTPPTSTSKKGARPKRSG